MRSLTYVDIKYRHFCLCKWNWDFIFHKTNFENSKKLESIVNIFVFFIKMSCQSKESPLSKQSPLYSNPTLSGKKYFISILIAKLEELNPSPFVDSGGREGEGGRFELWYVFGVCKCILVHVYACTCKIISSTSFYKFENIILGIQLNNE